MSSWYKALEDLVWVAQLGVSVAVPPLGCLALSGWLAQRFGLGGWVYAVGLVLGLGAGGVTFRDFLRRMQRRAERDSKNRPSGFNRH